MRTGLYKALDDCINLIKGGEAVKSCLDKYPYARAQLMPLLHTALAIFTIPKVVPSEDFRKQSRDRFLARVITSPGRAERARAPGPLSNGLGALWRGLERAFSQPVRIAVPLTLVLILAVECVLIFGGFNFILRPSATALASQGTLSIMAGGVQLQVPGATTWEEAKDGMTVASGSRVKTGQDAQALLTFFNGTTITLEPGTDLLVERLEGGAEKQPGVIVLRQWLGTTISRVTKLADTGGRYEIQTPSAIALVRGTVFVIEVNERGSTRVQTFEGLVGVSGQGKEVYVPAGQQTIVEPGVFPSDPTVVSTGGNAGGQGGAGTPPVPGSAGTGGNAGGQGGAGTPAGGAAVTGGNAGAGTSAQDPGAIIIGGSDKSAGSGEPGNEILPAQIYDTKELPSQNQEEFSWENEYDRWAVILFIGIILVPFIMMLIMWRRQ